MTQCFGDHEEVIKKICKNNKYKYQMGFQLKLVSSDSDCAKFSFK